MSKVKDGSIFYRRDMKSKLSGTPFFSLGRSVVTGLFTHSEDLRGRGQFGTVVYGGTSSLLGGAF